MPRNKPEPKPSAGRKTTLKPKTTPPKPKKTPSPVSTDPVTGPAPTTGTPDVGHPAIPTGPQDERQQTFNDGETGPVHSVSVYTDLVTRLNEIMLDVDPQYLRPSLYAGESGTAGERLFEQPLKGWLDRHPLLKDAEVRFTGTGVHVLPRLDPPVTFDGTNDRDRWAAVVRCVQGTLPSDPNAPGLNALTRPVGSVNSKSGRPVTVLRHGTPIHPDRVLAFVAELQHRPFATVCKILHGGGTIRPCPLCRADGSALAAMNRVGRCYKCGKVTLAQLLGGVMADPTTLAEGN